MNNEICMNLFQRLSYLKSWYDKNHTRYLENRTNMKVAFSKKYHNEIKRYTAESKKLKKRRDLEISVEKNISYQDWVERAFQKLLQKISHTNVEFQKKELLDNFAKWQKDFAPLDYNFRVYTLELYYKVELARFNSEFDAYIIALREGQANWLYSEDEKYNGWNENHPWYKELQELEYQYDCIADDDLGEHNFNYVAKSKGVQHKTTKNFVPSTIEQLEVKINKPTKIKEYVASYF